MIAPNGAVQINIRFTEFNTNAAYDTVRVSECSDAACTNQKQLAELSGTYSSIQAVTSNTGFMKVVFNSDSIVNAPGFTASWSSVC